MAETEDHFIASLADVMRHVGGEGIPSDVLANKIKIASMVLQTKWDVLPYSMQRDLYFVIEQSTFQLEAQGVLGNYIDELRKFKMPIGSVELASEKYSSALQEDLFQYRKDFPVFAELDQFIETAATQLSGPKNKSVVKKLLPTTYLAEGLFKQLRDVTHLFAGAYERHMSDEPHPATYKFPRLFAKTEARGDQDPHFYVVLEALQHWDLLLGCRRDANGDPEIKSRVKDIGARATLDTRIKELEVVVRLFDELQRVSSGEAQDTEINIEMFNHLLFGYYAEMHITGVSGQLPAELRKQIGDRGLSLTESEAINKKVSGTARAHHARAALPKDFVAEIYRHERDIYSTQDFRAHISGIIAGERQDAAVDVAQPEEPPIQRKGGARAKRGKAPQS